MGSRKSKIYFSALLVALLYLFTPTASWATFNLIRDAQDPTYKAGLQSFKAKDYKKAYNTWLPIAKKGNSKAQYYIGYIHLNGLAGFKADATEAKKWFEKAAGKGDAQAQNDLGTLYLNGQGVRRNLETALNWYQQSAKQGNATAQYNTGLIYQMKKRYTDAKIWFTASSMQGYAKASYSLHNLNLLPNLKLPNLSNLLNKK